VSSRTDVAVTGRPFVVAHRAGNDLRRLRRAERVGVALVEADVHLFAGRLEVRHHKTVGRLPILWDRWELQPPWTPRLTLDRLLATAAEGTELMLDLKGRNPALSAAVRGALEVTAGRPVTVCSQRWPLVEALHDVAGVRVVHSVGGARQLAGLRALPAERRLDGISIHRRVLTHDVAAELHSRTEMLMTWPVTDAQEARELAAWGVDGVITEQFERLERLLAVEPARGAGRITPRRHRPPVGRSETMDGSPSRPRPR
jgi:glycerophosphoryl diester phosphodiesterase